MQNNNIINLVIAIILSMGIVFGWQYFVEKPRVAQKQLAQKKYEAQISNLQSGLQTEAGDQLKVDTNRILDLSNDKKDDNANDARVKIKSTNLSGSILLKGLRIDDLILLNYKNTLDPDSDNVTLLSPAKTSHSYFIEMGWLGSNDSGVELPTNDTLWSADRQALTPDQPITLSWVNLSGVEFVVKINMDDEYLFTIEQMVNNKSSNVLNLGCYGLINKSYASKEKGVNILHQGPIAVFDGKLQEYSYDAVQDKKSIKFPNAKVDWVGITDKYWLTAFIPDAQSVYSATFNYAIKGGMNKFQVDFLSSKKQISPGETWVIKNRIFAGAKKVKVLDEYSKNYDIKLFDRAIDFGWFYILTKPVFNLLSFFYTYVGNFGISILIVTVLIKLAMFFLANKSYRSMKSMKALQPEIERIKSLYGNDKTKLNQEIMSLYKKQKINPVAGCLPIVLQIPVFFSIYKVLYVTIEMRHAPFFGWIKDLSEPDPTSVFNLFGLLNYNVPSFLMIGAWPLIMAITMYFQQKMNPEPSDPVQAQVMRFMPLFFLFMFSSFPVGLLIYWSWNNVLSILQQYCINKLDK